MPVSEPRSRRSSRCPSYSSHCLINSSQKALSAAPLPSTTPSAQYHGLWSVNTSGDTTMLPGHHSPGTVAPPPQTCVSNVRACKLPRLHRRRPPQYQYERTETRSRGGLQERSRTTSAAVRRGPTSYQGGHLILPCPGFFRHSYCPLRRDGTAGKRRRGPGRAHRPCHLRTVVSKAPSGYCVSIHCARPTSGVTSGKPPEHFLGKRLP